MMTSEEVRSRPARAVRLAVAILLPLVLLTGVAGVQSGQAADPHPLPSVRDAVADGPGLTSIPGRGSENGSAHPPHPGRVPPGSGSDAPWGAVFSDTTFLFPERLPLASGGDEDEGEVAHDALTDEQRARIQAAIDENIRRLDAEGKLPAASAPAVLFQWPLKLALHVNYYDGHTIWDYVDHDPAYPGQVLDYNCGNRTYDWSSGYNHGGTDHLPARRLDFPELGLYLHQHRLFGGRKQVVELSLEFGRYGGNLALRGHLRRPDLPDHLYGW
jgi:hypothetical protein